MSGEEASVTVVNAAPEVADEPQAEEAPAAEAVEAAATEPAADGAGGQDAAGAGGAANGDGPAAEGKEQPPAGAAGKEKVAEGGEAAAGEGGEDRELPNRPPQVFFNGAPAGVTQEDVEDVFSTYGKVARVELLLDYASKQTKGAGFVRYETVAAAADAVAALHGAYTFPGGSEPMTVRWAGGAAEGERKRKVEEGPADDTDERQLFLAKVTRHIPEEAVAAVLGQYGQVESLRMFKPTPDAVFHKGCGVVTYATKEECEYAMRMLDEIYVWEGMREAMVAKYNESEANKRRREDAIRSGPRFVSLEPPPPGCDIDALKLFVDNIPTTATVEDIRAVFKGFGRQIIQILVARDRETGEPKGSAYIWFSRRKDADLAIRRLHDSTRAFSFVQPSAVATAPEKPAGEEGVEKAEGEAEGAEGAEGEAEAEAEAEKKQEEPAGPKPLVVKWATSAVRAQRPGERPPSWMRQAGPPPFRGPPPMRGPPPGAWGPPPGAWGPPPGMGGWGQHGLPAGPPPTQPDPFAGSYQGGYYQQQAAPPAQAAGGWGQQAPPQQAGWAQQAPPQQAGWGQQAPPQQAAWGQQAQPTQYSAQPTQYSAQPTQYSAQPTQVAPAAAAPAAAAPAPAYDYSAYYQQQQQQPQQQAAAAGGYSAPPQASSYYGAPAAAQPAAAQPVGGYASYPAQQAAPQQGGWGQQPAAGQQGYGY